MGRLLIVLQRWIDPRYLVTCCSESLGNCLGRQANVMVDGDGVIKNAAFNIAGCRAQAREKVNDE